MCQVGFTGNAPTAILRLEGQEAFVPSNRLTCPHCGHDGTLETSKPPLQSYGFNYLADGIVCREVGGQDESGRLKLSGDFKCEGPQAANARIECRSCWQTFAVPEGLVWSSSVDQPAEASTPVATSSAATSSEHTKAAAETIAQNLVLLLRHGMQQLERSNAGEVARLEASIAGVAQIGQEIPALRTELAGLRGDAVEAEQQLRARIAETEAALRLHQESQPKFLEGLNVLRSLQEDSLRKIEEQAAAFTSQREAADQTSALCAQLQAEQQALRQRLDAQADVIRSLHAAAQEHSSRREELRAAVLRLEEIAGALDQVKPLPQAL
jgi:hypothetical protein